MAELHDLSALDQAAAIRRREVSPVDLVEHYLARIAIHGESVGAFITVDADGARAQARAAERAVAEGAELPPLHGVPTAIKDLNSTAGLRTTFGSALMADFVPDVDDHVVIKLREAGTISLGKTNTPEFGFPCYTQPVIAPPARTPWDLGRLAAGSSGGAGAAVAAGLVPFAQGSDGGGSIRSPASVCGLFGIKTTRGRVSGGPFAVNVTGLGVLGPMARSVRDAAAMLDAMAGPMPGDPYWAAPLPAGESFLGHAERDPGRLRIGRYVDPVVPGAVVDPAVQAAWEDTSRLLESLGHDIEDIVPPLTAELIPHFEVVWSLSATTLPVHPSRIGELEPLTRWLLERGMATSAQQAMSALMTTQQHSRHAIAALSPYDVVLTPVCTLPPRPVDWFFADGYGAPDFERQKQFSAFTALYNMTGQPAVSIPLQWSAEGLPLGMMLVGRPADEATLISLSAQLEAAQPWAQRRPGMW
ncbi:MAG: amidase [Geodermatophilaceae bacterium]|nr:amidase [Geodermatophilaceae bacterium]